MSKYREIVLEALQEAKQVGELPLSSTKKLVNDMSNPTTFEFSDNSIFFISSTSLRY